MKPIAPLALLALVGCGGQNSSLNNQTTGLYTNQVVNDKERADLVAMAAKELGKGAGPKATAAMNDFGMRLLRLESSENAVISPFSISTALAMTLNGAEGETAKGMHKALGTEKLTLRQVNEASASFRDLLGGADPKVELKVANAIWFDPNFEIDPTFSKSGQEFYGAKIETINFKDPGAKDSINGWASNATGGKIPELFEKFDDDAVMVLANAVYFKGDWTKPFGTAGEGPFKAAKDAVTATYMADRGAKISEVDGTVMVAKPYADGAYEMVFVLPPASADEYLKELDGSKWLKLVEAKPEQGTAVIPRFSARARYSLKGPLEALGMKEAFDFTKANFSKLGKSAARGKTAITQAIHSVFIEVNETGTEAGAATAIEMATRGAPAKSVRFDRPFLYAIRETKTGLILFLGRVDDPSAQTSKSSG